MEPCNIVKGTLPNIGTDRGAARERCAGLEQERDRLLREVADLRKQLDGASDLQTRLARAQREIAELRERDRVISRQLERRADGMDPLTKSLRDERERAEADAKRARNALGIIDDCERWHLCPSCIAEVDAALAPPPPTEAEARAERDEALALVSEQANDEGLWFRPKYATEDYLQRALRRLHSAVEGKHGPSPASGWRDIKTAPKDGTALWLIEPGRYAGLAVPHHQIVGAWEPDGRYTAGGYWREVSRDYLIMATHWQPLPAPPTPGGETR